MQEHQFESRENQPTDKLLSFQAVASEENEQSASNPLEAPYFYGDPPTLTSLLQTEARMRRAEDILSLGWAVGFLITILCVANVSSTDIATLQRNLGTCVAVMGLMGIGVIGQFVSRSRRRKRSLTAVLSKTQDRQQISALIQTLRVQNTAVRNLAKRALIDLLPGLRASDAPLIGGAERAILVRQLAISPGDPGYRDLTELLSRTAFRREVNLRVSILQALEQVGGHKELPAVERLARDISANQLKKVNGEVRAAAIACLPYLKTRAMEQRASEQLLRPSSADTSSGSTLLRAAAPQSEAVPEDLLRAAEQTA